VFAFQDKRGAVEVAFTDRLGGVSAGPFASLNLALPGTTAGADRHERRDTLDENWAIVTHAMVRGAPPVGENPFELPKDAGRLPEVVGMRQVHGDHVEIVQRGRGQDECEADALATSSPGLLLAARAADCVPVLLADPERGLVSAVHAGRKGVEAGVVPNAVRSLHDLGAEHVVSWVGPHACGRCYEVPADLRDEVSRSVPEAWSETSWGTPALDLAAGVRAQLAAAGVAELVEVGRCTIEDTDFYSYRRDGVTGRQAGLIWVRP
jgi:YfiH family protein